MPAASQIILNGITITTGVKDISEELERIGVRKQAANGTRRFFYRGVKRVWNISMENLLVAVVVQLRGIASLTTTFTYTDESATAFTVLCPENALSISRPEVEQDGTVRYSATLRIEQV